MDFNCGFFIGQPSVDATQYSMSLDGINEYIVVPDNSDVNFLHTNSITMTAWVKVVNYGIASYKWILSKRDINYKGYALAFNSGNLHLFLITSLGSLIEVRTNGVSFTNNTWYQIGFTYDGSGSNTGITLYVNGNSVSKTLVSGTTINGTLTNTEPLYISNDFHVAGFINANIGIIRFWKTELTPTQMLEDYNGGTMLNRALTQNNLVFEFGAGRQALFGTNWTFPFDGNNPTTYSVNMEYVDRTVDIP